MSSYSCIIIRCSTTTSIIKHHQQQIILRKRIRNVKYIPSYYSSSSSSTKSYFLHPRNHCLEQFRPRNHRYSCNPYSPSSVLSCFSTLTDSTNTTDDDSISAAAKSENDSNKESPTNNNPNQSRSSSRKEELMEYIQQLVNYNTEHFLYHLSTMQQNSKQERRGRSNSNIIKKFKHELKGNYYRERLKKRQHQRQLKQGLDFHNEENDENNSVWNKEESDDDSMKASSSSLLDLLDDHEGDDDTGLTANNKDDDDNVAMKSPSSSLLDLLDDDTGNSIGNNEDEDFVFEDSKENGWKREETMIKETEKKSSSSSSESSPSSSSLLDLLDDYDEEDFTSKKHIKSKINTEAFSSSESSAENEWQREETTLRNADKSKTPSLLDLLDDHNDDNFTVAKNTASKINTEAISSSESSAENEWKREQAILRNTDKSKTSSLLDLLDDHNDDNFTVAKNTASKVNQEENAMGDNPSSSSSSTSTNPRPPNSLLGLMNENYNQDLEHKDKEENAGDSMNDEKSLGSKLFDLLDENHSTDAYDDSKRNQLDNDRIDTSSDFLLKDNNNDADNGKEKKTPSLLELLEDDDAFNLLMDDKKEVSTSSAPAAATLSSSSAIDDSYEKYENIEDDLINEDEYPKWDDNGLKNLSSKKATTAMSDVNIFTNYDDYNDHFEGGKNEELTNNSEKEGIEEDNVDELNSEFDSIFDKYNHSEKEEKEMENKQIPTEAHEYNDADNNYYQFDADKYNISEYYEASMNQSPKTFKEILNRAIALRTVTKRSDWDMLFHQDDDIDEKNKDFNKDAVVDDETKDIHEDDSNGVDASALFPSFSEEEEIDKNDIDTSNYSENNDAIVSVIQELLSGCTKNQWILSADEFNLLLLHVAASADAAAASYSPSISSSYDQRIKLLFRIYNIMTELSSLQQAGVVNEQQQNLTLHGREDEMCDDSRHDDGVASCAPNATTYFILLTALEQSGDMDTASKLCTKLLQRRTRATSQASPTADADVSTEMNILDNASFFDAHDNGSDGEFELDDRLLEVAMRILRLRHRLNEAQKLFDWATFQDVGIDHSDRNNEGGFLSVDSDSANSSSSMGGNVHVKCSVFNSLLRLYKEENMQKEAVKLIDVCLKENGQHDRGGVNSFLASLIQWPKKSRDGRYIRMSSHCRDILDAFERMYDGVDDINVLSSSSSSLYRPNYKIWKRLLLLSVNAAKFESPTHWHLVNRTFRAMMESLPPSSHPDHIVLRVGLDAAESTKDPKLAYDAVSWAWRADEQKRADEGFTSHFDDIVDDDLNMNDGILHEDPDPNMWSQPRSSPVKSPHSVHVPPQAYLRVIRLCVDGDEVDLARDILRYCSKMNDRIPETLLRQMYIIVMAGYAKVGDVDCTKQLLSEMQNDGPQPSEKAYSAVIHALSINRKAAEASEIIESMLSNDYGDDVQPGPSSYASCMLSLVQSKDWEGVLSLNEKMQTSGVHFNPTTFQGVVMAHHRLGNYHRVLEVIEHACQTELGMDLGVFQTCIKLFLPNDFKNAKISHVRTELRHIGEKEPDLAIVALDLGRSLRIAELNKKRNLDVKRQCWNDVMKKLVQYIRKREAVL